MRLTSFVAASAAALVASLTFAAPAAADDVQYGPEWDPGQDYSNFDPQPDQSPFEPGYAPGTADLIDDLFARGGPFAGLSGLLG